METIQRAETRKFFDDLNEDGLADDFGWCIGLSLGFFCCLEESLSRLEIERLVYDVLFEHRAKYMFDEFTPPGEKEPVPGSAHHRPTVIFDEMSTILEGRPDHRRHGINASGQIVDPIVNPNTTNDWSQLPGPNWDDSWNRDPTGKTKGSGLWYFSQVNQEGEGELAVTRREFYDAMMQSLVHGQKFLFRKMVQGYDEECNAVSNRTGLLRPPPRPQTGNCLYSISTNRNAGAGIQAPPAGKNFGVVTNTAGAGGYTHRDSAPVQCCIQ